MLSLLGLWLAVAAVTFAYMAVTFEKPVYVRVEGHGRVPVEVARNLQRDGCLRDDKMVVCSVAWSKPCEDRRCLLGDAAFYGTSTVLAALLALGARLGWRRWHRSRRKPAGE